MLLELPKARITSSEMPQSKLGRSERPFNMGPPKDRPNSSSSANVDAESLSASRYLD